MTRLAINLMGYLETDQYSFESLKEVLEQVQFDIEDIVKLGVAVSRLPDDHQIVDKKLVVERIRKKGGLADVIASYKEQYKKEKEKSNQADEQALSSDS